MCILFRNLEVIKQLVNEEAELEMSESEMGAEMCWWEDCVCH